MAIKIVRKARDVPLQLNKEPFICDESSHSETAVLPRDSSHVFSVFIENVVVCILVLLATLCKEIGTRQRISYVDCKTDMDFGYWI